MPTEKKQALSVHETFLSIRERALIEAVTIIAEGCSDVQRALDQDEAEMRRLKIKTAVVPFPKK